MVRRELKRPGERSMPSLGNKSIAITRPVGQGAETSRFVRQLGWTPYIIHTVEVRPIAQSSILNEFTRITADDRADWIVFMSPRGADMFFAALKTHSDTSSISEEVQMLAVGPNTGAALKRNGV